VQLGKGLFQRLQALKQRIVGRVGDLGGVLDLVQVIVVTNTFPQGLALRTGVVR
jgi:hypothetical protein